MKFAKFGTVSQNLGCWVLSDTQQPIIFHSLLHFLGWIFHSLSNCDCVITNTIYKLVFLLPGNRPCESEPTSFLWRLPTCDRSIYPLIYWVLFCVWNWNRVMFNKWVMFKHVKCGNTKIPCINLQFSSIISQVLAF